MEFKIEKGVFLSGLTLAQGVADRKSTMPILANVLLRTEGKDRLYLAATDLNVTVTSELPATILKEGGLTLGAKHLYDIVKSLPEGELLLRRAENQYAEIKSGKVDYRMVGMADRDFPKLANQFDDIALVRSARAWAAQHTLSQTWVQIGRNPAAVLGDVAPNMGAIVSIEKKNERTPKRQS